MVNWSVVAELLHHTKFEKSVALNLRVPAEFFNKSINCLRLHEVLQSRCSVVEEICNFQAGIHLRRSAEQRKLEVLECQLKVNIKIHFSLCSLEHLEVKE